MRKLGDFKKVACGAAHKVAGKMRVKKCKALLLQLCKNVAPHVGLNLDAKVMAPIVYEPNKDPAQDIHSKGGGHEAIKKLKGALRNQGV